MGTNLDPAQMPMDNAEFNSKRLSLGSFQVNHLHHIKNEKPLSNGDKTFLTYDDSWIGDFKENPVLQSWVRILALLRGKRPNALSIWILL